MKSQIERRPALALAAGFIIGLTCILHPINLLLLTPVMWVFRRLGLRIAVASLALAGAILGPIPAKPVKESYSFSGPVRIVSAPRYHPATAATASSLALDESMSFECLANGIHLRALVEGDQHLVCFQTIDIQGEVRPPWEGLDGADALQGIQGRLRVRSWRPAIEAPAVFSAAASLSSGFVDFAKRALPPKMAGTICAICFNVDTMLDDDLSTKLRRTGTIHIVSASGLHVIILAVVFLAVIGRTPMPRGIQFALLALLLAGYAIATGLNPPVVRAVLMVIVGYVAYLFRREPDALSALATSAIVYLLWRPEAVYSIGFQLSFVTVSAFALFFQAGRRGKAKGVVADILSRAGEVCIAGLIAMAVSAPLLAYHFGQFSLISPLVNLCIELVIPVVVVISFIAYGISFLAAGLATWLMQFCVAGWLGSIYLVLDSMSAPKWAVIHVPEFNGYWLLLIYGAIAMLWRPTIRQPI